MFYVSFRHRPITIDKRFNEATKINSKKTKKKLLETPKKRVICYSVLLMILLQYLIVA